MDLQTLYAMQDRLNKRIRTEHHLENENLLIEQIVALEVELGELANETRCFKYWSQKPPAPREVILEEYVDGLHFILSLGIEMGFHHEELNLDLDHQETSLVEQFQIVFDKVSELNKKRNLHSYEQLFSAFLQLGRLLGFEKEEMTEAYFEKNKVNHQRQDEGY